MRLCFDATRFGSGLYEAVELAASKNLTACEFGFSSFEVEKGSKKLSKDEKDYLDSVHELCSKNSIEISALKLRTPVKVSDKNSLRDFKTQIDKLAKVAAVLKSQRIIFQLEAEAGKDWLLEVEKMLTPIVESLKKKQIKLSLSLSTPEIYAGKSLRGWRPLEPQEWRELLAGVPDLSLSFSVADCAWQGIDYLRILPPLVKAIEHVEAQDVQVNRQIISDSGLFGPLWWRYMTVGKGQVDWGQFVEALKLYEYNGDLSITFNDEFACENEQGLWEALDTSIKVLAPLVKY